jgi:poly [ADP-ribose] polymerase
MSLSRATTAPSTPKDAHRKSKLKGVNGPEPIVKPKAVRAKSVPVVAEVDIFVPHRSEYKVMIDPESGLPCTAMLNQTNLAENNNKFFLIQALESVDGKSFASWFRWGRVGYTGQTNLQDFTTAEGARECFMTKFSDKTLNEWSKNIFKSFNPCHKKYTLLAVESLTETKEAADSRGAQVELVKVEYEKTKLETDIYELIKLISSREMFESELKVAGLDLTRMPLGRISQLMIKNGYDILKQIEKELLRVGGPRREVLSELSGKFYTVIPHSFGFSKAISFVINSFEKLREKSEVLESLENVREGIENENRMEPVEKISVKPNPVDDCYQRLGFILEIVPRDSSEFSLIQQYKENTQGESHIQRSSIRNIYKLKNSEDQAVKGTRRPRGKKPKVSSDGRMLLWHGSRLTNWVSILSHGLKIAPPEAPHTGYMFGKGIYTADCFSKAANYCFVSESRQKTGLVVLCEVDLGKSLNLLEADYEAEQKLGSEFQSTKGVGKWFPDPQGNVVTEEGLVVPTGKLRSADDKTSSEQQRSSRRVAAQQGLLYNEYIVYEASRVRMKYLVELEFAR